MSETLCDKCKGCRLNEYALAVKINKLNIHEFSTLSIEEEYNLISNLELTEEENEIAKMIIHELESRLGFLKNVGLEYLSLTRTAETLSGGEAQRINYKELNEEAQKAGLTYSNVKRLRMLLHFLSLISFDDLRSFLPRSWLDIMG